MRYFSFFYETASRRYSGVLNYATEKMPSVTEISGYISAHLNRQFCPVCHLTVEDIRLNSMYEHKNEADFKSWDGR
jgi:hypothetical protein